MAIFLKFLHREENCLAEFIGLLLLQGSSQEVSHLTTSFLTSYGVEVPIYFIQCPEISTSRLFIWNHFNIFPKWKSRKFGLIHLLSPANTRWQISNSSSSQKVEWDNRKVECDATNGKYLAQSFSDNYTFLVQIGYMYLISSFQKHFPDNVCFMDISYLFIWPIWCFPSRIFHQMTLMLIGVLKLNCSVASRWLPLFKLGLYFAR